MSKINEHGVIQSVILLVLLAGLAGGVILVRQTQIFKPKAKEFPVPSSATESNSPQADRAIQLPSIQIPELGFLTGQNSGQADKPAATLIPVSTKTPSSSPIKPIESPTSIPSRIPTLEPKNIPIIVVDNTPSPSVNNPIIVDDSKLQTQVRYRLSFDSNFSTLIDTGDQGIFGAGTERIIPISLPGDLGQKYVFIQFFEKGQWTPAPPIVASINLINVSDNVIKK